MKGRIALVTALLLLSWGLMAQNDWWNSDPSYVVPIDAAAITADRPMRDIGVQETKLDTIALRDNIALSIADVLTFNSSVFVKQYGRGSLSTIAFRGTSASHTQVSWNGMKINSPMLGMTDFSMIPSYFIDDASLLHGTSSLSMSGGGLGGCPPSLRNTRDSASRPCRALVLMALSTSSFVLHGETTTGRFRPAQYIHPVATTSLTATTTRRSTANIQLIPTAAVRSATSTYCRRLTTIPATATASASIHGIWPAPGACPC